MNSHAHHLRRRSVQLLVELPDHIHHTVQYSFWPPFYHPAPTPYTRNLRKTTSPTGDTNHRTHGPQMSALITTACRLHTTSHAFLNSQYSHDPHTKHNQFNVKFLRSTPPTLVSLKSSLLLLLPTDRLISQQIRSASLVPCLRNLPS